MSKFTCEVMVVGEVTKHQNADRLSIVRIRGYNSITNLTDDGTPRYAPGDTVVYIPEGAAMPEWLLQKMGFWKNDKGTLAGKTGTRVKAMTFRKVLSQGLLYPMTDGYITLADGSLHHATVGDDVAGVLGIIKYEPIIPECLIGEVCNVGSENTVAFDIENLRMYPDVFVGGEDVVITEKLHGTFCAFAYVPELGHPEVIDGSYFAFSKRLGATGLAFKNNEINTKNAYHKTLTAYLPKLKLLIREYPGSSVFVLGELYGSSLQDLKYDGITEAKFRFFAVVISTNGHKVYLSEAELTGVSSLFDRVPVLYRGPFSIEAVDRFRSGASMLGNNIREGIVITPAVERRCDEFGRVSLKSISEAYLLRGGNPTEYD